MASDVNAGHVQQGPCPGDRRQRQLENVQLLKRTRRLHRLRSHTQGRATWREWSRPGPEWGDDGNLRKKPVGKQTCTLGTVVDPLGVKACMVRPGGWEGNCGLACRPWARLHFGIRETWQQVSVNEQLGVYREIGLSFGTERGSVGELVHVTLILAVLQSNDGTPGDGSDLRDLIYVTCLRFRGFFLRDLILLSEQPVKQDICHISRVRKHGSEILLSLLAMLPEFVLGHHRFSHSFLKKSFFCISLQFSLGESCPRVPSATLS